MSLSRKRPNNSFTRTAVAIALLAVSASASALDEGSLAGTWVLDSRHAQATMKLDRDHVVSTVVSLKKAFGKAQELWSATGTWKLDNKNLVTNYTRSPQGKIFEETNEIVEITDNHLRLKDHKGTVTEYVRAK